ncbi:hypothetical protein [Moraxella cuniculi]|uniref:Multidrug resistance protein n=1 Tax=Moraxella cuniculi TaxID=34061 RepID=A0A448GUT2_9GAMM|nr:hypothetical protein [Moraxella cuniculi]VEG12495.1 multidrug resistance protein [Moraxella cuniculi]
MNNKHIILLFLSLLLGSFGDEAVQIIFALQLGDAERVYLTSALLLLGMLGGLCANVIYSRLAARFSARQLILFALFAQAVLVMVAATTALPAVYLTVSLMLGFLGGLLWSAVLILIPVMSTDDKPLEQINKYAHSIRNMGFMAGPMLGGTFSYLFDVGRALLWVAVATSLSGMVIWLAMCGLARLPRPDSTPAINGLKSIGLLLQNKQILTAIAPTERYGGVYLGTIGTTDCISDRCGTTKWCGVRYIFIGDQSCFGTLSTDIGTNSDKDG